MATIKQVAQRTRGFTYKSAKSPAGSCRHTGKYVPLLPKNMNMPFWQRLKEWLK